MIHESQCGPRSPGSRLDAYTPENRDLIPRLITLPSSDTAAMLFWALMASGQITMRKVDGWASLATPIADHQPVALAA